MKIAARTAPIFILLALVGSGLAAQEAATATAAAPAPATTTTPTVSTESGQQSGVSGGEGAGDAGKGPGAEQVRREFQGLVYDRPSELATILATEPSLLANDAFMAGYPDLARFVSAHPEIRTSPRYYLAGFPRPGDRGIINDAVEFIQVGAVLLLIAFALSWVIRTLIEQKRWNRLSRIQTEVHNKILDRFSTSQELLDYIRSSAGTKFLESAPIPVRAERPVANAPLNRILWSIQLGVVIAIGALAMLAVSARFEGETAAGFFAMGAIAFGIGAGFIASGFVSIFLSRRLGLWSAPAETGQIVEEVR